MKGQATRGSAWAMSAAACVLLMASVGLALVAGSAPPPEGFSAWSSQIVGAVALLGAPVLGAVLVTASQGRGYGWWWCLLGFGFAVSWFAEAWLAFMVAKGQHAAVAPVIASVGDVGWVAAVSAMPFLFLYFPTGAAPSPRWRSLEIGLPVAAAIAVVGLLVSPGEASIAPVQRAVLTSALAGAGRFLVFGGVTALFLGVLVALASLAARYRTAPDVQRAQIKWVIHAAAVFGASLLVLTWWDPPGVWDTVLESLPLVWLYAAIGIAVLRHRVVDVDLLINRSLVYAVLSIGLAAGYILIVGLLSVLFDTWLSLPIAIVGAAFVTVTFQPLRERVQRSVNRLLYGERDDPFAVVSRLARRLEEAIPPEDVLPTVVDTTARALRLRHASVWQYHDGGLELAATHGTEPARRSIPHTPALVSMLESRGPTDVGGCDDRPPLRAALAPTGATLAYPLQHRGAAIGLLCVGPRGGPRDAWSKQDLATLADLARHVGAAVHATMLAGDLRRSIAELQQSRELLVDTQERERRRMQRDLHDGLGPTLAAVRLHLEACLDPHAELPPRTRAALERIDDLVREAASDVRRLVSGLHPPLVAQLGLGPALTAHVDQFGRDIGIQTRIETDEGLTASPAVEVGVFRVAQEALTNVAKHAQATCVQVRLASCDGGIRLVVRDDGCGLPPQANSNGTGLASMRERAALLGGRLTVSSPAEGGTEVSLDVPEETPP